MTTRYRQQEFTVVVIRRDMSSQFVRLYKRRKKMKNKKIYVNPSIEIIELSVEDIITTSTEGFIDYEDLEGAIK